MRLLRPPLLVVLALLSSFPATAAGKVDPLPVGETNGVRMVRDSRGALVVLFTRRADRLWRRVAGRRVTVRCLELPDREGFGLQTVDEGQIELFAPRRGRRIRTGDLTRGQDYCSVALSRRRRAELVVVPLTQRGAVYLDERAWSTRLFALLVLAEAYSEDRGLDRWPTADELLETTFAERLRAHALAGPDETPSPGRIGYWSDGARQVAAAAVSALGRRLFIRYDGDALETNVLPLLPDGFGRS